MEDRERGKPNTAKPEAEPLRGSLRPRGPVHMSITATERQGAVCLEIQGELDVLTAPKLSAELSALLRRSEDDVIVDLRQAAFIDSAGLQVLLGAQRRLNRASRKLNVICDDGPVRRVIELTRLEEALGLTASENSAAADPKHTPGS